ncbi:MAG: type VI secretion system tube protein Hcp [Victivallales bacterium]|jgi:type VI secretion system Hcp family effector|nr:type VI secretion system tube protein Hcp [Victivallales bacterium]MBT7161613.1 type VI secretion system tube protein Hcp [Victivallales bacterium]MBT7304481.1 type VI secretion system tube protein Hcp [Victivallales bacterium]
MAGYIKFEGLDGEALDKGHKGWSDIMSFSQALTKPGSGTGATRRRGDVILEDLMVVKEIDKATPKLAEAICKGRVFATVQIEVTASFTDAGRVTFYRVELKNAQVASYSFDGAVQADEVPMETVCLNFEEIKVTYTECDTTGKTKGNIEYTWKVEEGE